MRGATNTTAGGASRWTVPNLSTRLTPRTRSAGVPNQPKTPHRTIRIDPALWERAQARAAERGETVSDAIRRALTRYAR